MRTVLRHPTLDAVYRHVAAAVRALMADVSPFADDAAWNPHISLAFRDLLVARVGEVMRWLAETTVQPGKASTSGSV